MFLFLIIVANKKLLTAVDDEWLVKFYKLLARNPHLFYDEDFAIEETLISPFVKLQNGSFVAPYKLTGLGLVPNVFLPTKQSAGDVINFVDSKMLSRCENLFINVLRLEKPDKYQFFLEYLRKKYKEPCYISDEDHIFDLRQILSYKDDEGFDEIMLLIKTGLLFKCKSEDNLECKSTMCDNAIYLLFDEDANDIKTYLYDLQKNQSDKILYIDIEFYNNNAISAEELAILGINDNIRINDDIVEGDYKLKGLRKIPKWHSSDGFLWGLSLKYLEDVLDYIVSHPGTPNSREKSKFILQPTVGIAKQAVTE